MGEHDPLRDILGEELYEELDSLDEGNPILAVMEGLTPDVLDAISVNVYSSEIVFEGAEAFDLVAALQHGAETGCRECFTGLIRFSAEVIGSMWHAILAEEGLVATDEGDETSG